jgi:beta-lactamase superfamily II metal-dependent hydrolase
MSLEVEFLPVGEGSKAGDCIVIRYGAPGAYELMVVDGGTTDSGKALVAHIRKHFPEANRIAHVVLTHADLDHASGLRELFGEFSIGRLWMHVPWILARDVAGRFEGSPTPDAIEKTVRAAYNVLDELVDLAAAHKVPIEMPFSSTTAPVTIGPFTVLSPSREQYLDLLPQFDRTPEASTTALDAVDASLREGKSLLAKAFEAMTSWVLERWNIETLVDGKTTSASNESSLVLYGVDGPSRYLLTGDAGTDALTHAADAADALGLPLQQFDLVQVPHHGSRHNVGPTILDRVLGRPIAEGSLKRGHAYVSVPKDDTKHPRKVVMNAFLRRGYPVYPTQGLSKVHWGGFPPREGYSTATPMAFQTQVESYD